MAIAWVSQGTIGVGTTAVTPGLPASLADGDAVLIQVVTKPDTATIVTPAGWSLVADVAGGGGTTGAAVGPTRQVWLFREKDASWSTMPAITVTGGSGTAAVASRYTKAAGQVWSFAAATGVYGTAATTTNGAATMGTNPGIAGGDLLVVGYTSMSVTPTWSAQNVTVPGAPVAVGVERSEAVETTNGNDVGGMYYTVAVSSGTASGAPSTQATASAATRGTVAVVRLRESAPLPAYPAGDASSPATIKSTTGSSFTTASFTPPANAAIVVGVTSDADSNAGTTPTITDSTAGRFTWTRIASSGHGGSGDTGLVALFAGVPTSPGTSPGAMTVTVTPNNNGASKPRMVRTTVYTSAVVDITDPIGAFVVGAFASGTTVSASVTPETTGGGIRMMWLDWNATGVPTTTQADTVVVDSYHNAGLSTNLQLGKTIATVAGVAQTIGATLLAPATDGNWLAYELRAPSAGGTNYPRSTSDTVTVTDATAGVMTRARATTDGAVVTDTSSATRTRVRSTTDVVTATDTLARAVARSRAASDAVTVTDVTAGSIVRNITRSTTDSAVVSDTTARISTASRSTTDSAAVADVVARSSSRARATSDAAAAVDTTSRVTSSVRAAGDAVVATDTTAPATTGTVTRSTTDAVTVTDTTSARRSLTRAIGDAAVVSDATAGRVARSRSTADSAVVSDGVARSSIPRTRSTADTITITDTSSASTTGNAARSVLDSIVATDTTSRRVTRSRSTSDAAVAADSTSGRRSYPRGTVESITVADLVTRAFTVTRVTADGIVVTDTTTATTTLPITDVDVILVAGRQRHVAVSSRRTFVTIGSRQRTIVRDGHQLDVDITGRPKEIR